MINYAIVFPGQGSQSLGMLAELGDNFPIVKETFAQVSDSLHQDFWKLVQNGSASDLNQTINTQVIMLTADIAVYKVLQNEGLNRPKAMAGHSLGEYPALVASGALSLQDAAILVLNRARIMQESVPLGQGAMAAIIGLDNALVERICLNASTSSEKVCPANFNSIGQVVIAGNTPAVEKAIQIAESEGATLATLIPVSVPCHCDLLKEASKQFASYVQQTPFKEPEVPVLSNIDAEPYRSVASIQEKLIQQLYSPVQWVRTVQKLESMGIQSILECGPGRVLTGLIKRIDRSIKTYPVNDMTTLTTVRGLHE